MTDTETKMRDAGDEERKNGDKEDLPANTDNKAPLVMSIQGVDVLIDSVGEPLAIADPTPGLEPGNADYSYDTSSMIIGDTEEEDAFDPRVRACFNCGSTEHMLSSCPQPSDSRRIVASREAYKARKAELGEDDNERPSNMRFFQVPEWRQQRLEWLEDFDPGCIVGAELRDAVGLPPLDEPTNVQDEDVTLPWFDGGDGEGTFGGMLYWGYPPGWTGSQNPKDLVRDRILRTRRIPLYDTLTMHNDDDSEDVPIEEEADIDPPPIETTGNPDTRWAKYRTNLFSSDLLIVSNVDCPLPPVSSAVTSTFDNTFTRERNHLWSQIVNDHAKSSPKPDYLTAPLPPWRLPDAFSFHPRIPPGYIAPKAKIPEKPPKKQSEKPAGWEEKWAKLREQRSLAMKKTQSAPPLPSSTVHIPAIVENPLSKSLNEPPPKEEEEDMDMSD